MDNDVECPKCGSTDAKKVTFTWWGGLLGPKLFNHVKCLDCGTTYNGKTGQSNTRNIVIYTLVVGLPLAVVAFFAAYYLVSNGFK